MSGDAIAKAVQRRLDRPDIHQDFLNARTTDRNTIVSMVVDLKHCVPDLTIRQISSLVGVGRKFVNNALKNMVDYRPKAPFGLEDDPAESWSEEENAFACADSLSALRKIHPGGFHTQTDFTSRTLSGMMPDERTGPVLFTAPDFRDPYRRADQSHTVKRPITLATQPYSVAA